MIRDRAVKRRWRDWNGPGGPNYISVSRSLRFIYKKKKLFSLKIEKKKAVTELRNGKCSKATLTRPQIESSANCIKRRIFFRLDIGTCRSLTNVCTFRNFDRYAWSLIIHSNNDYRSYFSIGLYSSHGLRDISSRSSLRKWHNSPNSII